MMNKSKDQSIGKAPSLPTTFSHYSWTACLRTESASIYTVIKAVNEYLSLTQWPVCSPLKLSVLETELAWVGCNWLLKFKHGHLKFLVSGRSKQASKHTHAYAQWSHASVGLAQINPSPTSGHPVFLRITVTLVVEHMEVACLLLSTLTIGGFLPWHGLCALFKYLCLYNWQSKVASFLMP